MKQRPEGGVDARAGSARTEPAPMVIRKYANRRLYNTVTATYVTLKDLRELVQAGADVVVIDVPTGADITRQILGQIILDAEAAGETLLPDAFLRHLITLYGDDMGSFLPSYLQLALDAFTAQKDRFTDQLGFTADRGLPADFIAQQVRRNLTVFDRAMKMFGAHVPPPPPPSAADFAELYARMGQMQAMLDRLAGRAPGAAAP